MKRILGALVAGSLLLHCSKWPDPAHNDNAVNHIVGGEACQIASQYSGQPGTMCGGSCTDLQIDPMNCGSCGNACPSTQSTCADGVCCDPASGTCGDGGYPLGWGNQFEGGINPGGNNNVGCGGTGIMADGCCGSPSCSLSGQVCMECGFGAPTCASPGATCCQGAICPSGQQCTECGCLPSGYSCCQGSVCTGGQACTACGCLTADQSCCSGTVCEFACQICNGVQTCVGSGGCPGATPALACDGGTVPTNCTFGLNTIAECLAPDAGCAP